jgi:Tfp pilus assembly protein PilN
VSASLNLARRPFRNERLPTIVLALGCVVLAIATVRHALLARDLLPGRSRDVMSQVVSLDAEIRALRDEEAQLGQLDASPEALKEWAVVQGLVDRRAFSWTGLFASLEKALPPGVRLVSIAPTTREGRLELALVAVGRQGADALDLLRALQAHADFEHAFLNGWTERQDGVDISCTVRYAPKASAGRRP